MILFGVSWGGGDAEGIHTTMPVDPMRATFAIFAVGLSVRAGLRCVKEEALKAKANAPADSFVMTRASSHLVI